jgi:hypothetical protein
MPSNQPGRRSIDFGANLARILAAARALGVKPSTLIRNAVKDWMLAHGYGWEEVGKPGNPEFKKGKQEGNDDK